MGWKWEGITGWWERCRERKEAERRAATEHMRERERERERVREERLAIFQTHPFFVSLHGECGSVSVFKSHLLKELIDAGCVVHDFNSSLEENMLKGDLAFLKNGQFLLVGVLSEDNDENDDPEYLCDYRVLVYHNDQTAQIIFAGRTSGQSDVEDVAWELAHDIVHDLNFPPLA